jgi:hypothetical protein
LVHEAAKSTAIDRAAQSMVGAGDIKGTGNATLVIQS